jgi:hypothetical protein
LLLIDIEGPFHLILTLFSATVASLIFAAATQGWFMTRSKYWESGVLIALTFVLFRPGFIMDEVFPPYERLHGNAAVEAVNAVPDNGRLRLFIEGMNIDGDEVKKGVLLPLGPKADTAKARFAAAGVQVVPFGEDIQVVGVQFGSQAEKLGIEQGFKISAVELPNERPAKEWIFLPAFIILGLIVMIQRRRAKHLDPHAVAA